MTLAELLEQARDLGYLGPGPVDAHIEHAGGIGAIAELSGCGRARALDLGSGAGVPGLVLATRWPDSRWVLLESRAGRARFLEAAVAALDLGDRVTVRHVRAEEAGRDPELRSTMDVVTSRSFGPPGVTAECASPFLKVGGALLATEPPTGEDRWPEEGLAVLGLVASERVVRDGATVQILRQVSPCPERFPRRPGVPSRRPLF